MSVQAEQKPKLKHKPDLDLLLPHSVEECSARLEQLADSDPRLSVSVALLAQDGAWDVDLARSDTNPLRPDFSRVRFTGALRRSPMGGSMITGHFILDHATFVTRGLWLTVTGPLLILLMLRVGFRAPVLALFCAVALGWLIYMIVMQPEKVLARRKKEIILRIEDAMR